MHFQKFIYFCLLTVIGVMIMIGDSGCANIIPPTGGPRDSLPPVLMSVSPKDSSLNFTHTRVTFNFNEFVEIQNLQENLIVSPVPKISPQVESKLRTVTVRIKDTLEPNTTYSINFGNAIRDINEGNVLKNFTYVFSTGPTLDTNELSGKVILAESGKTDSTLTVMLHRNADDSAIIKERPRYIARLTGTGDFLFHNLPSGTFHLFAIKDEGGTFRYLSKAQLFAFHDKPLVTGKDTEPVTLYAFVENPEEPKKPVLKAPPVKDKKPEDKRLRYQTNLDNNQQDLLGNLELQFTTPLKRFDSTKVIFSDEKFVPITNHSFTADSLMQKITLFYPWKPDAQYHLTLDKDFAEDSLGRKLLKNDTIVFKARKEADYGSLRLRFPTVDLARNPVVQFLQGDKIVYSSRLTNRDFYRKLFKPGDYELQILYDENNNGKWDPGSYVGKHIQPEKVQAVKKKVPVKANWDNDTNIEL